MGSLEEDEDRDLGGMTILDYNGRAGAVSTMLTESVT